VISFTPLPLQSRGKRLPDTHWIRVCVGTTAGVDCMEKLTFFTLRGLELRTLESYHRFHYNYVLFSGVFDFIIFFLFPRQFDVSIQRFPVLSNLELGWSAFDAELAF
jgi:hypothetical protein